MGVLLFGRTFPTLEQAEEGYEPDPERHDRDTPCETYGWIGQDFAYCEYGCGKPCWEHPYEPGLGDAAGLRRRLTHEDARRMWRKWGEPKGIPFRGPRPQPCLAQRDRS